MTDRNTAAATTGCQVAFSTATVSALNATYEFQRLTELLAALNSAEQQLKYLAIDWDGLDFVERRMPQHRNRIVRSCPAPRRHRVDGFNAHDAIAHSTMRATGKAQRVGPGSYGVFSGAEPCAFPTQVRNAEMAIMSEFTAFYTPQASIEEGAEDAPAIEP